MQQRKPIIWTKLKQKEAGAASPLPRSGHTLTPNKGNYIMFGGTVNGLKDPNYKRICPTNEVWFLEITSKSITWTKANIKQGELPAPRSNHVAVSIKKPGEPSSTERIFIHGGMGENGKYDDCYFYDHNELKFTKIEYNKNEPYPSPRANHAACIYNYKIYLFGGNGGKIYENTVFKDLWEFDIENKTFTELILTKQTNINLPEPRSGISMFEYKDKLMIYGGWNQTTSFNNMLAYPFDMQEWISADIIIEDVYRWNHCGIEVEAVPSWKYFIFGGSSGQFDETKPRERGTARNDVYVVDLDTKKIEEVKLEDINGFKPQVREDSTMAYHKSTNSLIVFGGWNNEWYDEVYSLCVSSIVGPSYSVKYLEPNKGKISGNQEITLYGTKLSGLNMTVFFISGNKIKSQIANIISESEAKLITPNFSELGAKEVEVRISIDQQEESTNPARFFIYYDTKAEKSIFFGPGCIEGAMVGVETSIFIRARNDYNENRNSGRDNFIVKIVEDVGLIQIPTNVIDNGDGTYLCKFTPNSTGKHKIEVLLKEDNLTNHLRGSPINVTFTGEEPQMNEMLGPNMLNKFLKENFETLEKTIENLISESSTANKDLKDIDVIINIKNTIKTIENRSEEFDCKLNQIQEYFTHYDIEKKKLMKDVTLDKIVHLSQLYTQMINIAEKSKLVINPIIAVETENYKEKIKEFDREVKKLGNDIRKKKFATEYSIGPELAFEEITKVKETIDEYEKALGKYTYILSNIGLTDEASGPAKSLEATKTDMKIIENMWTYIKNALTELEGFKDTIWAEINGAFMDERVSALVKELAKIRKEAQSYTSIVDQINAEIQKKWKKLVPLIINLKYKYIQERHWDAVREIIRSPDLVVDDNLKLRFFYEISLHEKSEEISEVSERALNEDKMDKALSIIKKVWSENVFNIKPYTRLENVFLLEIIEDNYAQLEDHMTLIQTLSRNRFKQYYEKEIDQWKNDLNMINELHFALSETQKKWTFLESLFIGSDEIKKELPQDTEKFVIIDEQVKKILSDGCGVKSILKFSISTVVKNDVERTLISWLHDIIKRLDECEKSLNIFMESKRTVFPRFYFISSVDLLDILSNGNNPELINKHINKVILAIEKLELVDNKKERQSAKGMHTRVGTEYVNFHTECKLLGKVENYLALVLQFMKTSLNVIAKQSLSEVAKMDQQAWIEKNPSQLCLLTDLMVFCQLVETSMIALPKNPKVMQEAYTKQVTSLNSLIKMVMKNLTEETMAKIMVLIKSETHCRDVIDKLINERVTRSDEFQWQSQLKAYWDDKASDCHLNVCDAEFWYGYEYLGNGDRLVVTPLTDRIYVTATQALHLKLGCAPAGPAGTGKTETTKDLASALGKACYVFNCSDQMDYKGMGDIFRGLAASGSWGCFDEFNRLVPEVLSVCSMQFKCITDALKRKDKVFIMEEKKCDLDPTCGAFITMNPGYLGRSELPEGLKALFRPITVVVPDFEMISENCLMAQGFIEAKILSKKFVVLYSLCQDLLSKQMHYDWGLRAIKSVLVVAGAFKRADPDMSELQLLKRALRDFNLPKIVKDDLEIFHGLISDLFPKIEVERKQDLVFEEKIKEACDLVNEKTKGNRMAEEDSAPTFKLFKEPEFVLKVVQLKELLEIRHSVFVMGNAGSGKSSCWKTLAKAFTISGNKTEAKDLNPKSISADDLYGRYINIQTRDFKYGILSSVMKTMSTAPDRSQKWIILDGDLDANWIENMNSVMDDNKVLTLPNNDRIDLLPNMRMIFEIRDLKYATKATVSRAGILYISDEDGYQWKSYIKSWIECQRFREKVKTDIEALFGVFVEQTLSYLKNSCKFVVSQVFQITYIISLCKLLEAYLDKKEACKIVDKKNEEKKDSDPYVGLETIFCFCVYWACGAILTEKDGINFRINFSEWFKSYFKNYRLPGKNTIFDYWVDFEGETKQAVFKEWSTKIRIENLEYRPGENIKYITVPTSETFSVSEIMQKLLEVNHPSLLIGNAGCGKTQICKGMLENKSKASSFTYAIMNFNYYTDTYMMQNVLISNTEKLVQRTFVPKGNPQLMAIFIDDLNMQQLDKYNTQNAIELVRQFMDYKHIYEMSKLEIMEFINIQFVASMNPTAGSFNINPRLQRHFWICAIPFPTETSITTIYNYFLTKHFDNFKTTCPDMNEITRPLILGIIQLHQKVSSRFRKSAINFHYEFNIRHITGVFQGVLMSTPDKFQTTTLQNGQEKMAKLWLHECERVYGDRLVTTADLNALKTEINEIAKKTFKFNFQKYFQDKNPESLIFCRFVQTHLDNSYDIAQSIRQVGDKANIALGNYNDEGNAVMELVLFDDAVRHVCRITRIVSQASGHALLVGVGGSGKQSLSKLSSYICGYTSFMITISQEYKINNFKEDLQKMYNFTGTSEDNCYLFILTEGQIVDEKFMVPVNDLLSSGEIQDLFTNDDKEAIINKVRLACKGATGKDSPQDVWNFFISRVKKNLHMSICFSPGDNLRNKSRKFPAIVNTTVIDWYQPWPEDALLSVGKDKLERDLEDLKSKDYFESVAKFMPYSFKVVGDKSKDMFDIDRRFTYVTPKSFLELLKLFVSMYKSKIDSIAANKSKLEQGLKKLIEAQDKIAQLEKELVVKKDEISKIKVVAEANDKSAREQAEIVGKEAAKAEEEKTAVDIMKVKIQEESDLCQKELAELKPIMDEAQEQAGKLNKADLDKVKAFKPKPPDIVFEILGSIMLMVAGQVNEYVPIEVDQKRLPKVFDNNSKLKLLNDANALQKALGEFLNLIKTFKVNDKNLENVISKHGDLFKVENKEEKSGKAFRVSSAVGALYEWMFCVYRFYDSAKTVQPKQKKVDDKKIELQEAVDKCDKIMAEVAQLNAKLEIVLETKRKAEQELNAAAAEEQDCKDKLDLAKRFINALGSSSERWELNIKEFEAQLSLIIGDILIASAFVSYCGPFPKKYRDSIKRSFIEFAKSNNIPMSKDAEDPLKILTNDAEKAGWNNQKLPADPVSIENATILTNSERWSLIIDPQLQGIKWLREKEAANRLLIMRINDKKLVQKMGDCIEEGRTALIENLDEMIDATLGPVIGRNPKKRGNVKVYQLGNNEYNINNNFKLILHTKLSNPHYPPEIQAETTLINFTVTEDGLDDQLLALIVKMERPKLAARKEEVIQQQNECKIKLSELEEGILQALNTSGDLLENRDLIAGLETSKEVSEKVAIAMAEAKKAEIEINDSSNFYKPASSRGSLIFFLMTELYKLHSFYLYSLESYIFVIQRAVNEVARKWKIKLKAEAEANKTDEEKKAEEEKEKEKEGEGGHVAVAEEAEEEIEEEMPDNIRQLRVNDLTQNITEFSFFFVRRGLFERHKLIFSTLITFRILFKSGKIKLDEMKYLIEGKKDKDIGELMQNVKEYLNTNQVQSVKALEVLDPFANIVSSLTNTNDVVFWKKWLKEEKAESSELPKSVAHLNSFQKLLLIRALRPDRIIAAISLYIIEQMTEKYIEQNTFDMNETYKETNKLTPIFFVLFPGVDPTNWVEDQGKIIGKSIQQGNLINIPMGQGQEDKANKSLEECAQKGNWIMLQNVHLMSKWLKVFENNLERVSMNAHPDFRCFISSEPPPVPTWQIIPEPIIQSCIKVANEAPQDLKANMRRAWRNFNEARLDSCTKKVEFKSILFSLCFFHSLVIGRKKFGSIGWSRIYNFNEGDLTICADVLNNYLENYEKVPYEDLKYIYGEIMYGGHITDNWDRRTNNAYLKWLIKPELLTGCNLAPNFKSPDAAKFNYEMYSKYIEEKLPIESPNLFHLHANAEISYLTTQGETLFDSVFEIQGGSLSSDASAGGKKKDDLGETIKKLQDELKANHMFKLSEIKSKVKELGPYDIVALQECERLNYIFSTLLRTLEELEKGLNGELNITDAMEELSKSLRFNKIPAVWDDAAAYPSKKSLISWFADLIRRHIQMTEWTKEMKLPKVIMISLLCNPMSFVTAVKQVTARKEGYALDNLDIMTDVTNFSSDEHVKEGPQSGVYVYGLFVQGAKWEESNGEAPGFLTEMAPKELDPKIPVMHVFSIPNKEKNTVGYYESPVFYTTARGGTYIFTAYLKMESEEVDPVKWVLAGVALFLSSDE